MILTDTSVLIQHFRKPTVDRAKIIASANPVICGVTVAEFWAGARTPKQILSCQSVLAFFGSLLIPEPVWELAGRNQAMLLTNGLTVPITDTVIATVAIATGLELWAYDTHFTAMTNWLPGLKLFVEPTT